jgi:hypothetical protein
MLSLFGCNAMQGFAIVVYQTPVQCYMRLHDDLLSSGGQARLDQRRAVNEIIRDCHTATNAMRSYIAQQPAAAPSRLEAIGRTFICRVMPSGTSVRCSPPN